MSEKHKILIESEPFFIKEQSSPEKNRYVFAYTITITNQGDIGARLLTRQWLITDSNGKIQEVNGEGVIGQQPYLKPNEIFRYTSGAILETDVGIMQGQYFFIDDDGTELVAPIPRFTLSIPRILH
ncbi:MAG: Co2+/Mg2+ efflux protein ApaG [Methylococcaceae bacterium]|nr:Co2+/Mg2+ efflux protein ApaG [Methylococcaceae bacterium]